MNIPPHQRYIPGWKHPFDITEVLQTLTFKEKYRLFPVLPILYAVRVFHHISFEE
ncbi:hypothetical protein [Bacillus cereus]|uniref:hypothetical protein n=1 Tax=Bacillus cereus TaxID=1396 RepID=UPI0015D5154C|nr:hypothetical protein [Bacillus cereus]